MTRRAIADRTLRATKMAERSGRRAQRDSSLVRHDIRARSRSRARGLYGAEPRAVLVLSFFGRSGYASWIAL